MKRKVKDFGIDFKYAEESEPLGTGGALKNTERLVKGSKFYALNGDILTNIDIGRLSVDGAIAAIALVPLRSPFGIVVAKQGKVLGFEEKPLLRQHMINAGIYLMDRKVFEFAPRNGSLEKDVFEKLAPKGMINATEFADSYWRSIDSLKDMEEANKELAEGAMR
ncbi:MAG: nucleotidyltransferase family protein [Candidatus Micrarchaeia archaeon]